MLFYLVYIAAVKLILGSFSYGQTFVFSATILRANEKFSTYSEVKKM
jgi:hypothetical protein